MKYLKYIMIHKWYVFLYCVRLGIPFRGIVHDNSKFLPSEWNPYNNYFYNENKDEQAFDLAWLKHQKRNKHHWQYWILMNDSGTIEPQIMPIKYVKEMVADWCGAGIAITGKLEVDNWYDNNKDKMILHEETRYQVCKLLFCLRHNIYSC